MNTKNSRIRLIRKTFCNDSNVKFAEILGKEVNTTSNWCRDGYSIGRGVASEIASKFNVNIEWILNGTPPMLKTPEAPSLSEEREFAGVGYLHLVPKLPISAQGGSFNDFVASIKENDCEMIISPVKAADFAITISGDSMAPEYPSGCQILIKKINESAFIEWGKVYVLDTCNGTIIKEVHKGQSNEEIECHSINPDPKFQPFNVRLADIYGMYRVIMCMSLK